MATVVSHDDEDVTITLNYYDVDDDLVTIQCICIP